MILKDPYFKFYSFKSGSFANAVLHLPSYFIKQIAIMFSYSIPSAIIPNVSFADSKPARVLFQIFYLSHLPLQPCNCLLLPSSVFFFCKLHGQITREFLRLRMQSFLGIVFIWNCLPFFFFQNFQFLNCYPMVM